MKKFLFVIIITGFGLAQDIHICVDSSANGYTLLLQIHESISFSPMTDTILIVNRGFTNSNNLNITRTTGALSSFMTSSNVYQGQLGPARYPSAIAGTQLYITFPFLISGAWGGMGAQKISGSPVDVGNGDLNIHRVTGKQLPNSNLVFIGVTTDNQILAYTWDANLSQLISNNIIGINSVYVGCDCNGGVFYIFYRSLSDLLVYYRFTVDGINWTSPQQWSIPGFSSSIGYMQMALTDNGAPRIVFDAYSESDSTYRIYVSYASGVPPVMLVSVRDTTCFYPTIATGGNYCAVLYCRSRNMGSGPANRWDFYIVWSSDNGITWGQPLNCTQSLTYNPGLPQLAKRIDTVGMRVYYIYLAHINNNDDPYWTLLYGTPVPFRIYLGAKVYTGIKEKKIAQSALLSSNLSAHPNPFKDRLIIRYRIPDIFNTEGDFSLAIYDVTGRVVKSFNPALYVQNQASDIIWSGDDNTGYQLAPGVYYLILRTEDSFIARKLIKLK